LCGGKRIFPHVKLQEKDRMVQTHTAEYGEKLIGEALDIILPTRPEQ